MHFSDAVIRNVRPARSTDLHTDSPWDSARLHLAVALSGLMRVVWFIATLLVDFVFSPVTTLAWLAYVFTEPFSHTAAGNELDADVTSTCSNCLASDPASTSQLGMGDDWIREMESFDRF